MELKELFETPILISSEHLIKLAEIDIETFHRLNKLETNPIIYRNRIREISVKKTQIGLLQQSQFEDNMKNENLISE